MSKGETLTVAGHQVTITNRDKVFYPATGFTKGQVIDYYLAIAPVMVPHLKGRPINLKRYPDGVEGPFFFQKECPVPEAPGVRISPMPPEDTRTDTNYCVIEDAAGLIAMAQLASIEIHTYLAYATDWRAPTLVMFDLDPGEPATVLDSAALALELRGLLEDLGLQSFAKTSGGKGLHLAVPLNTPATYDETKGLAHALAEHLAQEQPERAVANMRKDLRAGKVFVDWSQNVEGKSTVCVYSLRARERPTVSTPVTWEEVEQAVKRQDPGLLRFEAEAVLRRVERLGDLWEPVLTLKQKIGIRG